MKQTSLRPIYVFIRPPSLSALEQRLRDRKTETEESLRKRLGAAAKEMQFGEGGGNFDKVITNDDVDRAYGELREFVMPEIKAVK